MKINMQKHINLIAAAFGILIIVAMLLIGPREKDGTVVALAPEVQAAVEPEASAQRDTKLTTFKIAPGTKG